jgi:hypothetical protein
LVTRSFGSLAVKMFDCCTRRPRGGGKPLTAILPASHPGGVRPRSVAIPRSPVRRPGSTATTSEALAALAALKRGSAACGDAPAGAGSALAQALLRSSGGSRGSTAAGSLGGAGSRASSSLGAPPSPLPDLAASVRGAGLALDTRSLAGVPAAGSDDEDGGGPGSQSEHRRRVCNEFFETERAYVADLQTLVRLFKAPMRDRLATPKPIAPADTIDALFSNVDSLLEVRARGFRPLCCPARPTATATSAGSHPLLAPPPRVRPTQCC